MKRVMIIGQPGAGKSSLARAIGEITHLPVVHMDQIHWTTGWQERSPREKEALCAEVHARPEWVFEGGRAGSWPERLARADTLIWVDLPAGLRLARILRRTLRYWGRTRPDLPAGCPETFNRNFLRYVWATRRTQRAAMQRLYDNAPAGKTKHRLTSTREVRAYLYALHDAVQVGNLGISHR